ncbi:MAG: NAD-dependent epimerase/dehydratase family protein [Nocardioidaceae bacterium]
MRVVILGATGNLGTALLHELKGDQNVSEIVAVARRVVPRPAADDARISWRAADIAKDDLIPILLGADAVVHLAWLFQPTHRPDVTWANNVIGTVRLLEAVERAQVGSLIVSSSVAAYSPRESDEAVDESWPTHGTSAAAYAREKAYVERLLDAFEARVPQCQVARLRPAFVFHRRAATQQRRLFMGPLIPGSLLRPGLIPLLPTPQGLILQTVHSDDAARAFAAALMASTSGAYNVCADGVLLPDDIAQLLDAKVTSVPPRLVRAGLKAAWLARTVPAAPELLDALLAVPMMSNDKAKAEWGWSPQVSAADAVQAFFEGARAGDGYPTPPLNPATSGPLRFREVVTGVGTRP